MNCKNLLKTGAQFRATDALGQAYRYEVVGVDLGDLLNGVGCSCIVLKNLDTGLQIGVEAAWFSNRTITDINLKRNTIEVPCTAGTLYADNDCDNAYPEIFIGLRRPDGTEIDICSVGGDAIFPDDVDPFAIHKRCDDGLKAYFYSDPSSDNYTHSHTFSAEELAVDLK